MVAYSCRIFHGEAAVNLVYCEDKVTEREAGK